MTPSQHTAADSTPHDVERADSTATTTREETPHSSEPPTEDNPSEPPVDTRSSTAPRSPPSKKPMKHPPARESDERTAPKAAPTSRPMPPNQRSPQVSDSPRGGAELSPPPAKPAAESGAMVNTAEDGRMSSDESDNEPIAITSTPSQVFERNDDTRKQIERKQSTVITKKVHVEPVATVAAGPGAESEAADVHGSDDPSQQHAETSQASPERLHRDESGGGTQEIARTVVDHVVFVQKMLYNRRSESVVGEKRIGKCLLILKQQQQDARTMIEEEAVGRSRVSREEAGIAEKIMAEAATSKEAAEHAFVARRSAVVLQQSCRAFQSRQTIAVMRVNSRGFTQKREGVEESEASQRKGIENSERSGHDGILHSAAIDVCEVRQEAERGVIQISEINARSGIAASSIANREDVQELQKRREEEAVLRVQCIVRRRQAEEELLVRRQNANDTESPTGEAEVKPEVKSSHRDTPSDAHQSSPTAQKEPQQATGAEQTYAAHQEQSTAPARAAADETEPVDEKNQPAASAAETKPQPEKMNVVETQGSVSGDGRTKPVTAVAVSKEEEGASDPRVPKAEASQQVEPKTTTEAAQTDTTTSCAAATQTPRRPQSPPPVPLVSPPRDDPKPLGQSTSTMTDSPTKVAEVQTVDIAVAPPAPPPPIDRSPSPPRVRSSESQTEKTVLVAATEVVGSLASRLPAIKPSKTVEVQTESPAAALDVTHPTEPHVEQMLRTTSPSDVPMTLGVKFMHGVAPMPVRHTLTPSALTSLLGNDDSNKAAEGPRRSRCYEVYLRRGLARTPQLLVEHQGSLGNDPYRNILAYGSKIRSPALPDDGLDSTEATAEDTNSGVEVSVEVMDSLWSEDASYQSTKRKDTALFHRWRSTNTEFRKSTTPLNPFWDPHATSRPHSIRRGDGPTRRSQSGGLLSEEATTAYSYPAPLASRAIGSGEPTWQGGYTTAGFAPGSSVGLVRSPTASRHASPNVSLNASQFARSPHRGRQGDPSFLTSRSTYERPEPSHAYFAGRHAAVHDPSAPVLCQVWAEPEQASGYVPRNAYSF